MTAQPCHATFVEKELDRRRRSWFRRLARLVGLAIIAAFLFAFLAVAKFGGAVMFSRTPVFEDERQHFLHASIGSEHSSGIPYVLWQALPVLFPEDFAHRKDYAAFGFRYEEDEHGRIGLPVGISRRPRFGMDLVWFNCAACHAGTYRMSDRDAPVLVAGMPANNFNLHKFITFLLEAGISAQLAPGKVFDAAAASGNRLGPLDKLIWRFFVLPQVREGLVATREALRPLLDRQPDWGVGRVDTFNPYKTQHMNMDPNGLSDEEVIGASDFPSIFLQQPREGMNLHWDGNNDSLAERNLSASLGAGVTPETVDHYNLERVARWLGGLTPPPSPHTPPADAVERGRRDYMALCADCHGYQGDDGYVFEGRYLGEVEDISDIRTDVRRLNSYTIEFNERQLSELFAGTPYRFRQFEKTNGYANMPLDGLWLRGPYLHNGSVPTLADLLLEPHLRPSAFLRGSDVVDGENGGFRSPDCPSGTPDHDGFCYDTTLPGNGNGGHEYGTGLSAAARADLLAYLLTF